MVIGQMGAIESCGIPNLLKFEIPIPNKVIAVQ